MLKKILIANRGEIAIRIMRTCRLLGLRSVAIYSEADRNSLHVMMADEAYEVGPSPSSESYLNINRILDVAKKSNSDAVHPGYGFLSESPDFASAIEDEGMVFIGPSAQSIRQMGDKIEARKIMSQAGVPVVPGSPGPVRDVKEAKKVAQKIGYPVLIKASAGGGGRGIRIVKTEERLLRDFEACQSEGKKYFNDDTLFVEKFIEDPKHIEIQVFCDHFKNAVHMFDRECSVQRRHQKIVEEAPSPSLSDEVRQKMCEVSVRAVKDMGYRGAGTLEFVFDQNTNQFYFIEMNTRLQVEHGITEMIIGKDLVKEQICVASNQKLSMRQEDIKKTGHAIELRICAEDPLNFTPSPGKIRRIRHPQGPFVRVDSYVYPGFQIPIFYDPMFTKLLAWGKTRRSALSRIKGALREFMVTGIKTNVILHRNILNHEKFLDATYTTQFVDRFLTKKQSTQSLKKDLFIFVDEHVFLVAAAIEAYQKGRHFDVSEKDLGSQWKQIGRMRSLRNV